MLGETEGKVGIEGVDDVFVVCENALGGLGTEVGDVFAFGLLVVIGEDGADVGSKHHVELADGAPVLFATDGAFGVGGEEFFSGDGFGDAVGYFIGAEAGFTVFAFD